MNRAWMRAATAAALVAALPGLTAAALPGPAAAALPGPAAVMDQPAAFAEDVALIAATTGWSPAATAAHLQVQYTFGALADQLSGQYPDRFAGARLAPQPGGTSQIWFKGPVPPGAADLVDSAGIPVALVGGRPESAAELRSRAEAVAVHLSLSYEQVAAAVRADGWVEAAVNGGPDPVPDLPPALATRTQVTLASHPVLRPEEVIGSARVQGNGLCTSGFTVVSLTTGVTGVTTAGHCTGINTYLYPTGGSRALSFQGQHLGFFGDVEWHTSTDTEPNRFYANGDPLSVRSVTSVQSLGGLTMGSVWCVYGRSSNNRQCDDVYSTFGVTVAQGNVIANLIVMRNDNTIGGDSGGTWSFGNTAAGIHQGDIWLPFKSRNVYSVAALLPFALGVAVRT